MPKKDFTQIAFNVVQQATGEAPKPPPETPAKQASRKGGLKGGKTRMDDLMPEQRLELAKKAAAKRWSK